MSTTFYGIDYEKITVSTVAKTLDADKVAAAFRAVFIIEAASGKHLRMRYDGTAPTSTSGSTWADGQSFTLEGRDNLTNFSAIRSDDTDVTLHVHYESPNPADIP